MYYVTETGEVEKNTYESVGLAAKALKVDHILINKHIDKWIIGGINGYYLFSKELNNSSAAYAQKDY